MTESSGAGNKELASGGPVRWTRIAFKLLFVFLLAAAVVVEGYYIFVLRDKIERQSEELRSISIRLQSSKNESTDLREELSSMKKMAGEGKDGNTADGQH